MYGKSIAAVFTGLMIMMSVGSLSANGLDYFVTSPDMRWAYHVEEYATGVVIRVSNPAYQLMVSGRGTRLDVSGASAWTSAGEPRLPVFPAVFSLTAGSDYRIAVVPGEYREMTVTNLLPEASLQSRSIDDSTSRMVETSVPDPAIYSVDAFWPESFYTVNEAKGRGQRYLRIGIQPFKYNPVSGKLRFYPELEILITGNESGDSLRNNE